MRGLALLILLSGCSTHGGVAQWKYMSPEHVECHPQAEMKLCRQYGPHLICKCIVK